MKINININQDWFKNLKKLVPTYRYLNNNGIRDSFKLMKKLYPNSDILKFGKNEKSGFWEIPLSWDVRVGQLFDPQGNKIADYFENPLQLFSNSISFSGKISKESLLKHQVILDIAAAVTRTPAQVLLRWGVQRGTAVIPKTSQPNRLLENISVFDFSLSADQMLAVSKLDEGRRFNDPGDFCEQAFNTFCPIYE